MSVLIWSLLLLSPSSLALPLDAFSSLQGGFASGTYNMGPLGQGKFAEKIVGATAGFKFGIVGVGAHAEASYTDAALPSPSYDPMASGSLYPVPTGRALRAGLQGRVAVRGLEAMVTYFPQAQFGGQFTLSGGPKFSYSYSGTGYRADVGFRLKGWLWLRVGVGMFEMTSGQSSFLPGSSTYTLDPKLTVQEAIVSVVLLCTWRDKCLKK